MFPPLRSLPFLALGIHTGQTKNFDADAPASERRRRIGAWRQWIETYKAGL